MRAFRGNGSDTPPRSRRPDEAGGGPVGPDDTIERVVTLPPAEAPSFLGRDHALSELNAAIVQSLQGRGALVLISGEPGIGKTRLIGELSARAERAGVTALAANCWEGGEAPVFWPWVQVVRAFIRSLDPGELQRALGAGASEIAQLVPELGGEPGRQPAAAGDARFRLFDAISSSLRRAAVAKPLLIAIDNLHAADEASLRLLRFLASDLRDARVLLLGSYRDSDAGSGTPLWRLLGELGSEVHRIALTGLEPDDVGQLIREYGARTPDPELSRALHARTQGNPFFVREVLRLLGTGPAALDGVPDSVAQVIERRLSRIGDEALALLRRASVLGAEFTLELLADVSGMPVERMQHWLPALLSSRLLARDRVQDRYRFAHALVREVCYGQLDPASRHRLHREAARAIEARPQPPAAEVAFHYVRAGSPEDLARALASTEAAAQAARRLGAHEDAATHLERALGLLDQLEGDHDVHRCELLLELGAVLMARGAVADAQQTLARAARIARARNDAERLARAALEFGVEFGAGASNDREIELLEAALAALPRLPTEASALRARLLSRLSRALLFDVRNAECGALAQSALALARRAGDPSTLASVLYAHHQTLGAYAPAETRAAIADEVVQLAESSGDRGLAMQARALRLGDLLELTEIDRYRAECASYARLVQNDKHVTAAWHVPMQRATLAMLAGQFAEAERLGAEGLSLGRRIAHQGIEVFHHSVLMTIRYLQGRHGELLPVLQHGAEAYPTVPVFRSGLALAHAERGERVPAGLAFERLAADDFRAVPRDFLWGFNLALLSITAHFLGDAGRAAQLYDWLLPQARYNVRVTRIGISSIGAVDHYLGLLASTMGRSEAAVEHFVAAVASHQRQGALAMLANSSFQLARVRAARGEVGLAAEPRRSAEELARSLGIRLVLAELASPLMAAGELAKPDRTVRLRRQGEDWSLELEGHAVRLRGAVGMTMLARLVREPHREFAALDLRGSEGLRSDAGELLDAQAKDAYRARANALREEIAHAERANDLGRAERRRDELDQLERELSRAVGLGGRDRRAGATYERARTSVTKAIRAVVRRIGEQDEALGAHLERSLRTGTVCAYSPDPAANLRWLVED